MGICQSRLAVALMQGAGVAATLGCDSGSRLEILHREAARRPGHCTVSRTQMELTARIEAHTQLHHLSTGLRLSAE